MPKPSRSALRALTTLGLIVVASASMSCRNDDGADRPNVVLFVVDTLRADHCSAYGYFRETTPNLERLAADGVLFERAWSQAPWTLPSMVSMMSGRYALRDDRVFPPQATTLAERLRAAGYATAAIVANPLLRDGSGFDRGFDSYEVAPYVWGEKTLPAEVLIEKALRWTREVDEPFFLWLQLYDPHAPNRPLPELVPDPHEQEADLAGYRQRVRESHADSLTPQAVDILNRVIARYDAEVQRADRALGALIDDLQKRGRYDDTLIVFASDHGEGLFSHAADLDDEGEHPLGLFASHRRQFYEEALHTPLVVRGPGFRGGDRVERLAENVDIYPTVLAAAGISRDSSAAGRELDVDGTERRPAVYAWGPLGTAIKTREDQKLIQPTLTRRQNVAKTRLYDLRTDPDERRNLAVISPEDAAFLGAQIEQWRSLHQDALGPPGVGSLETERWLKELGYK